MSLVPVFLSFVFLKTFVGNQMAKIFMQVTEKQMSRNEGKELKYTDLDRKISTLCSCRSQSS